jgi:DNA-binding transcriptional LysR family regulator
MDLDSQRLRVFLAVAQARSFSAAARRLGKTQPSVSQGVARLERDLGQPLFHRRGRTTRLAPAGRLLLPHAERVLAELDRARVHLTGLAEVRAGELVVGTSDTIACHVLPPVFAAFRARHPGVELRLHNRPSPVTAARVADRGVEIGVVTLPLPAEPEDRLTLEPLVPHQDVVICPPDHPLATRPSVGVGELARHPLLLLDRTTGLRAVLEAAFDRLGTRPRVAMEGSSVEVCKRLVELGFGLSVVPAVSVQREVGARTLAAVRLRGLPAGRSVGLALPAAGLSPAAAAFALLCRAELAPAPGRRRRR